jgi:hypothetical protein
VTPDPSPSTPKRVETPRRLSIPPNIDNGTQITKENAPSTPKRVKTPRRRPKGKETFLTYLT